MLPAEDWAGKLITAAAKQVGVTLVYDPSYTKLDYPGGDVPRFKGVCTDVIIRAYRDAFGVDLQKLVHDDMKSAFSAYPKTWGLKAPDSNIDHRRVPNLQTFLKRRKADRPISMHGLDYQPGDIVTQRLPGNKTHIVLVSNQLNPQGSRPLAIHNIGWGARIEDVLFAYDVTGHYRSMG
ncbi:DUF1287 domain-containing protein [Rhizobium sp. KVB221]|uniref:DUF1287 domain-containing protein n=2 Tax=Rhizobium setariae TaxID=2801340 RepID=A0A937CRJ1_9HYPH|nr:DUF1287 domain-containing protein [Rhizobium setariae]